MDLALIFSNARFSFVYIFLRKINSFFNILFTIDIS